MTKEQIIESCNIVKQEIDRDISLAPENIDAVVEKLGKLSNLIGLSSETIRHVKSLLCQEQKKTRSQ